MQFALNETLTQKLFVLIGNNLLKPKMRKFEIIFCLLAKIYLGFK